MNTGIHDTKDPWLVRWIKDIKSHTGDGVLLELSCGEGRDTEVLSRSGLTMLATDISTTALDRCRTNVPGITLVQLDISRPFPFRDHEFSVIIASLCLHYFTWELTTSICNEIRRCLADRGLLIIRLNSTNDVNYGAEGYQELEPRVFNVAGRTKRFFNNDDVNALVISGWRIKNMEEMSIDRYEKPKSVWEMVLVKE